MHVYARPAGDPAQEAGGLSVCLLGWCAARGVNLLDVAVREIERIEAKPIEEIRGSLARKADEDLVTFASKEHAKTRAGWQSVTESAERIADRAEGETQC